MPALLLLKSRFRLRLVVFLLLLQNPVVPLFGAERHLFSSLVPAVVARGQVAALGRVPGTNQLRLALALPLRQAGELTNLLAAIYNPASAEFHHYLTPADFAARFGPTPADYAAVMHFARTNGLTVTATHPNRLLVDVTGQVADVERAFQVRLNNYRHPTEARNFFAPATGPVVDAALPLLSISGLDNFSLPHPNLQQSAKAPLALATPNAGSSPLGSYMGNDFRRAYVPGTPLTGAGQNVGLLQFDGFYPTDITNYAKTIGVASNVPPLVVVPVDGGVASPGAGDDEVSLDIEMILSLSPGVSNIYVYEAPNPSPWVDLLSQMADDNLAKSLSCSWSGGPADPAAEQIFQQMAAQGQSFYCAVGDADAFTGAIPFPCESPDITEVGGTILTTDGTNYVSETVWNRNNGIGTGGGVGSYTIPPWQLGVDMTGNGGSSTRRNVPDVALTAENVYVDYANGSSWNFGGTSCVAPLWAGFTALINQQAAQLGQPPVGFINPAIYALGRGTNYATAFRDVTTGNNTSASSPTNFYAVPGFDLCTGWGTPAGTNLINALTTPDSLLILPPTVFSASGQVGGPFTQTNWLITLTNAGVANLDWSLGGAPVWLSVSATGGTLGVNAATNVSLQLTGAETLPAGNYLAGLLVTNQNLSRIQTVMVQLHLGQSIVQNGGFETGDFTGWTLVGDTIIGNLVYNVVATDADFSDLVHSGNFGAFLGQGGYAATLSQSLPTTPGRFYLVSCWLDNPTASSIQQFSASWAGTTFASLTNPPAFTWTNFLFLTTAIGTNTLLQFAAENDPNYFGFDDVSVTPVPPVAFASFSPGTNAVQLAWNSLPGLNYQVQYKTNLAQTGWLNLGLVAAATNVTTLADTNYPAAASQRFYRLELQP